MLNRKFASIRANVKTDKRGSFAQNENQRLPQSRSMDMKSSYQRNNNIFLNLTKEATSRSISNERRNFDFDDSSTETTMRSPINTAPHHPYVNLMHQKKFNSVSNSPYQLQYQNVSQSTPDSMNQSWNLQNQPNPIPLLTHFTAAQIYMRPKVNANQCGRETSPSYTKKPPPEVPKRLSSTISNGSTSSLKKTSGLSRSSELHNFFTVGILLQKLRSCHTLEARPIEPTNFKILNHSAISDNNGSLQSVQSSGSESSVSIEKLQYENSSDRGTSASPLWKRKDVDNDDEANQLMKKVNASDNFKISEIIRKRKYRIGLNLFNKKPEKGIEFLVKNGERIFVVVIRSVCKEKYIHVNLKLFDFRLIIAFHDLTKSLQVSLKTPP